MVAYALMFLAGLGLVSYGAFLISLQAGLIVSGIVLVILSISFAQCEMNVQIEENKEGPK
jgi:hypothetical protein